jgi:hypothetical protein
MIRLDEVQWLLHSPKLISARILVSFSTMFAELRNGIFIIATDISIQVIYNNFSYLYKYMNI